MNDLSPEPLNAFREANGAPVSRVYGFVDTVRPRRVSGWAIDRADAQASPIVELLLEGRRIAVARAERPRPDLEKAGLGTGRYGFVFELDEPIPRGLEFAVEAVARTRDGDSATLERAGAANDESSEDRRLLERLYRKVATLEACAARPADPGPAAELRALVERAETVQARIEAALSRLAAAQAGQNRGRVGATAVAIAIAAAAAGAAVGAAAALF